MFNSVSLYIKKNKTTQITNIMAKKKLITLAREMEKETEVEYFDYLIDTYFNGNFSQCKRLFAEMKREDQKSFVSYCKELFWMAYEYFYKLL